MIFSIDYENRINNFRYIQYQLQHVKKSRTIITSRQTIQQKLQYFSNNQFSKHSILSNSKSTQLQSSNIQYFNTNKQYIQYVFNYIDNIYLRIFRNSQFSIYLIILRIFREFVYLSNFFTNILRYRIFLRNLSFNQNDDSYFFCEFRIFHFFFDI